MIEASDLAAHLPADGTSATYRLINPDWRWGLAEMLAAEQLDVLRWLQWSKTKDGAKNRRHPKPTPRPGVSEKHRTDKGRFEGAEAMDLDDLKKFLAAPRKAA